MILSFNDKYRFLMAFWLYACIENTYQIDIDKILIIDRYYDDTVESTKFWNPCILQVIDVGDLRAPGQLPYIGALRVPVYFHLSR